MTRAYLQHFAQPLVCGLSLCAGGNGLAASLVPSAVFVQAGFGDQDFYPDLIDKAAVLTCHLAWNHPYRTETREPAGHVS